jgi:hypothetical protein
MASYLQFYQTYLSPVIRYGVPLLVILGLWVALHRAGLIHKARATGILVTGVLLGWWAAADLVARSGLYAAHWDLMRPLCWAVAIAWLVPLTRSRLVGAALDAIPAWWLVALQVYRAAGGFVWLAVWASGRLPDAVGLTLGIGDTLTGVLAVVAAIWISSGARGGRRVGIAWNAFGLLDFATGFIIALFVPYGLAYPAVMIPAFLAPLSLDLHVLSIMQLRRSLQREPRTAPVLAR